MLRRLPARSITQLQKDLLEAEEKVSARDKENRDMKLDLEDMKRNQVDSLGAEESHMRVQHDKDRLQRRIESYQKTQKDLQIQMAELNVRPSELDPLPAPRPPGRMPLVKCWAVADGAVLAADVQNKYKNLMRENDEDKAKLVEVWLGQCCAPHTCVHGRRWCMPACMPAWADLASQVPSWN